MFCMIECGIKASCCCFFWDLGACPAARRHYLYLPVVRRSIQANNITSIDGNAFNGLTALATLYGLDASLPTKWLELMESVFSRSDAVMPNIQLTCFFQKIMAQV
jgi:hypothetical protein